MGETSSPAMKMKRCVQTPMPVVRFGFMSSIFASIPGVMLSEWHE